MKTLPHAPRLRRLGLAAILASAPALRAAAEDAAPPALVVVTTTPDLADIARQIGGGAVDATSLTKGPQDPHFLEAKPSFIKLLHGADLFVQCGLELEAGWAPALLDSARNPAIASGGAAHLDIGATIDALELPAAGADRSRGDLHVLGNPHFLLDPLNGLRAAEGLARKIIELRPESRAGVDERLTAFRRRVAERLAGKAIAAAHADGDVVKLLELIRRQGIDGLLAYLDRIGKRAELGGWIGRVLPWRGAAVIADHNLWPYFARRFDVRILAYLEPKPGIAPTTRHLSDVVETARANRARAILSAPYFSERHADFVAAHTGARVVAMAHQTGGRAGCETYLDTIEHDVESLVRALERKE